MGPGCWPTAEPKHPLGDNQVTLKVPLPQSSSQAVTAQQGAFLVMKSPLTVLGQLEVFLT